MNPPEDCHVAKLEKHCFRRFCSKARGPGICAKTTDSKHLFWDMQAEMLTSADGAVSSCSLLTATQRKGDRELALTSTCDGCRGGSAIEGTCSCRGPVFCSQHPIGGSLFQMVKCPFLTSTGTRDTSGIHAHLPVNSYHSSLF